MDFVGSRLRCIEYSFLRGSINNYPHYLEFDTGGIEMLPHHDAVGGYVCDHPYDRSKKANTYDSHTHEDEEVYCSNQSSRAFTIKRRRL
jgi:hypothetical protein